MLHIDDTSQTARGSLIEPSPSISTADLRAILGIVRLHIPHIIVPAVLLALVGVAYVLLREPVYTARTSLLVFNSKLSFSPEDAVYAESQLDPTFLETQIEILRSDKIALDVIDHLRLSDPDSEPSPEGYAGPRSSPAGAASPEETPQTDAQTDAQTEAELRRQVTLRAFKGSLNVERVGQSYVVEVAFSAADPKRAALITNDIARAYIEELNSARKEAAESASPWIRDRISGLGPRTRVIATASPPTDKSNVRGLHVIAVLAAAGLFFGLTGVFARELLKRKMRTPEQAAAASESECFGILPWAATPRRKRGLAAWSKKNSAGQDDALLFAHVLDHPLSPFWHTMRRLAVAVDVRRGNNRNESACSVGVTSTFSGEGKTTVAANFAQLLAHSGNRVLLFDCNPYNPTLSRVFADDKAVGLLNIAGTGDNLLDGLILTDPRTSMHFLPIGYLGEPDLSSHLIWSEGMEGLFSQISERYDYMVFDLPSLSPTYDVRAAAEILDQILVVVDWEKVLADHLKVGLASAGSAQHKLIGTVLNKVKIAKFERVPSTLGTFWGSKSRRPSINPPRAARNVFQALSSKSRGVRSKYKLLTKLESKRKPSGHDHQPRPS